MQKIIIFSVIFSTLSLSAQVEMKYNAKSDKTPEWAQIMYKESPDIERVIKAYTDYYKKNKFVKNKHTQYYKRWLRNFSRVNPPVINTATSKKNNQWECIGPWDFDKDAASRSYAPGSAHIYTVEQSISNPNILYAGSATAGAWKSSDKGDNWNLITKNLPLNEVYAIEIDFTNPEVIYISGNGGIYKSINSGVSWNMIGDISFTSLYHSIKDIKLDPSVLFLTRVKIYLSKIVFSTTQVHLLIIECGKEVVVCGLLIVKM